MARQQKETLHKNSLQNIWHNGVDIKHWLDSHRDKQLIVSTATHKYIKHYSINYLHEPFWHYEPEWLALCIFSMPAVLPYTSPHLAQMSDICQLYFTARLQTAYCVSCWYILDDGVALPYSLTEQGLTSHQTHYRSYRGRFLQVIWPNQQCQSTEENRLVLQIRPESHQDHSTMLQ